MTTGAAPLRYGQAIRGAGLAVLAAAVVLPASLSTAIAGIATTGFGQYLVWKQLRQAVRTAGAPWPQDTGRQDTGHPDIGHPDIGHPDTGHQDTGHQDTGRQDAGHQDAGHQDTGRQDAGPA